MAAQGIRARVRAEMITEIKDVARQHLATDGANLSLRAVARDMNMVSSALYRYFASRDDLLTALIIDAYNAIGQAVEDADRAVADRADLRGRWFALTRAVRGWGLSNPAEYALIYGSPVPGYAAPADTVPAAARTPTVLIHVIADGYASGALAVPDDVITDALRTDLIGAADVVAPGLPPALMNRGVAAWLQLFGVVSFELFGQFDNVIAARADFFDQQMAMMADLVGLPQTP